MARFDSQSSKLACAALLLASIQGIANAAPTDSAKTQTQSKGKPLWKARVQDAFQGSSRTDAAGSHRRAGGVFTSPKQWSDAHFNENRGLVSFPNYMTAHYSDGSQRTFSNEEHISSRVKPRTIAPLQIVDWYPQFKKRLSGVFVPAAPGGILALVRLQPGRVTSLTFYGLQPATYAPRLYPLPNQINETAIKESVTSALKITMDDPLLGFPQGVVAVDLELGFSGDPGGGSFHLTRDPATVQQIMQGKYTPRIGSPHNHR